MYTKVWPQLGLWTVVCWIAAGPSFFFAMMIADDSQQMWGVVAGVFTFVGLYTAASCVPWVERLRRNRAWRDAFRTGIAIRLFLSAMAMVVPYAMVLDVWAGFVSVEAANLLWRSSTPGGPTSHWTVFYLATLIQGVLLNAALVPVILIAWAIFRVVYGRDIIGDPAKVCVSCGYDLRASVSICPECGTRIACLAQPPEEIRDARLA